MRMYNILTGSGFGKAVGGSWTMAMLTIPILFFINVFANKFLEDSGLDWNNLFSYIGNGLGFFILISFTGQPRLALVGGIVGMALGGYFGGKFYAN
jgi:hypothetical protein